MLPTAFMIVAVVILSFEYSYANYLPTVCLRVPGKCDGRMQFDQYKVDPSITFYYKEVLEPEECRNRCTLEPRCMMARYTSNDNFCEMYNITSFSKQSIDVNAQLSYWECCQKENLCFESTGRCPGYWASELNTYYTSRGNPLAVLKNIRESAYCERACLTNSLCQMTMYSREKHLCHLKREWYTTTFSNTRKYTPGWFSMTWSCCSDTVLPSIDASCRFQSSKQTTCRGSWVLSSESVPAPKYDFRADEFLTFSYKKCWDACEQHPDCEHPYFNQSHSLCVLDSNTKRVVKEADIAWENMTFQYWSWECCLPEEYITYSPPYYGDCLRIISAAHVEVELYECNDTENMPEYKKTLVDHMAFYDKGLNRTLNGNVWHLVSNGFRLLWIRELSPGAIAPCASEECAYYSGAFDPVKVPEIVFRPEWYAMKAKKAILFRELPKFVVILNTYKPSNPCRTEQDCLFKVSWIQRFHMFHNGWWDIGYNFLIGENGRIYEGRGWQHVGAHTKHYNFNSLGIAFIGWFEYERPSLKALQAAKDLIAFGVRTNRIHPNYTIIGHRDVSPRKEVPGIKLYHLLFNWFHFHDRERQDVQFLDLCETYSELEVEDDQVVHKKTYLFALIPLFVFIIGITGIALYIYRSKFRHTKFCFYVSQHPMNEGTFFVPLFGSVPITSNIKIKDSQSIITNNNNTKYFIISNNFQSCQCRNLLSRLVDYAAYISHYHCLHLIKSSYFIQECKLPTCAVVFPGADIFDMNHILIFHTDEEKFIHDTINNFGQKQCLCADNSISLLEVHPFNEKFPLLPQTNIVSLISKTNDNELIELKSKLERVRRSQIEVKFSSM